MQTFDLETGTSVQPKPGRRVLRAVLLVVAAVATLCVAGWVLPAQGFSLAAAPVAAPVAPASARSVPVVAKDDDKAEAVKEKPAPPKPTPKPKTLEDYSLADVMKMDDPWSKKKVATVHDNGGSSR